MRILIPLALVAAALSGCGEKVDLAKEKSPDAGAAPAAPQVSSKPFKGGFKTQSIGSNH